jgi:hypothetical protein
MTLPIVIAAIILAAFIVAKLGAKEGMNKNDLAAKTGGCQL